MNSIVHNRKKVGERQLEDIVLMTAARSMVKWKFRTANEPTIHQNKNLSHMNSTVLMFCWNDIYRWEWFLQLQQKCARTLPDLWGNFVISDDSMIKSYHVWWIYERLRDEIKFPSISCGAPAARCLNSLTAEPVCEQYLTSPLNSPVHTARLRN